MQSAEKLDIIYLSIIYTFDSIEHIRCARHCTVIVLSVVILPTFPAGLPLKAKKPDGTEWPAQSEIREIRLSPGAHTSPFRQGTVNNDVNLHLYFLVEHTITCSKYVKTSTQLQRPNVEKFSDA